MSVLKTGKTSRHTRIDVTMNINRALKFHMVACFIMLLTIWTVLMPARLAMALTIEEERELGRQSYEQIRRTMNLVEDPSVTAYINGIGQKIVKVTDNRYFDYRFFVIDNDTLNAFAVPGGYVFIHSGLITTLKSEAQLAAIIGHEIAHVTSRHIAQRFDQSRNLSLAALGGVLAGIFIGGPGGQALMMGSMAGSVQAQLAYSREDEREADFKGLDYLVRAGYDPRAAYQSFEILLQNQWQDTTKTPTYLTTHPGLSERIGAVQRAVDTNPAYQEVRNQGDEKAFQAIQVKMLALSADTQRAFNRFSAALKENPRDAMSHYGLALLYQQQQNLDKAIQEFQQALENSTGQSEFSYGPGRNPDAKKGFPPPP